MLDNPRWRVREKHKNEDGPIWLILQCSTKLPFGLAPPCFAKRKQGSNQLKIVEINLLQTLVRDMSYSGREASRFCWGTLWCSSPSLWPWALGVNHCRSHVTNKQETSWKGCMIKSLKPQRIIYVLFGTGNHCTKGRFGFSCSFQPEFSKLVESQLSLHQQHHRFPTFTRQNHMVRPLHDQPWQRNRVLHRHPWAVTGATHAFYHCSMGIMCWVVRFGHAVVHHTSLGILEVHMDKWQQSTKMSFSNQGSTSQSKLFIFQSSSCSCLRDGKCESLRSCLPQHQLATKSPPWSSRPTRRSRQHSRNNLLFSEKKVGVRTKRPPRYPFRAVAAGSLFWRWHVSYTAIRRRNSRRRKKHTLYLRMAPSFFMWMFVAWHAWCFKMFV